MARQGCPFARVPKTLQTSRTVYHIETSGLDATGDIRQAFAWCSVGADLEDCDRPHSSVADSDGTSVSEEATMSASASAQTLTSESHPSQQPPPPPPRSQQAATVRAYKSGAFWCRAIDEMPLAVLDRRSTCAL